MTRIFKLFLKASNNFNRSDRRESGLYRTLIRSIYKYFGIAEPMGGHSSQQVKRL